MESTRCRVIPGLNHVPCFRATRGRPRRSDVSNKATQNAASNIPPTNTSQSTSTNTTNATVIGAACQLTGDIILDGDAIICGSVDGQVEVTGTLEIADSAVIKGGVRGGAIHLNGTVEGDVTCIDYLRLGASATLQGNIFANAFSADEGATARGHVVIGPHALAAAEQNALDLANGVETNNVVVDDVESTNVSTKTPAARNVVRRRSDLLKKAA